MFDRNALYRLRCVRTLIDIVEQVPARWQARPPMILSESSVGLLLLWSWLRFESDFLSRCLEEMGVDLSALTLQVDGLLKEYAVSQEDASATGLEPRKTGGMVLLDEYVFVWLERAKAQSDDLVQKYLGVEHLLLAYLSVADSPIASLFARHGVDYSRLQQAILELISSWRASRENAPDIEAFNSSNNAVVQFFENLPAPVGMPKRFSMSIMMAWVTLFAIVFSGLKLLNAPLGVFGIVGIVMFCVGVGQMWLFGGNKPRVASIVSGAASLSLSSFIYIIFSDELFPYRGSILSRIVYAFGVSFFMLPVGAFLGYLAGGLTAGVVLGIEYFENRNKPKSEAEAEELPTLEVDEGT